MLKSILQFLFGLTFTNAAQIVMFWMWVGLLVLTVLLIVR